MWPTVASFFFASVFGKLFLKLPTIGVFYKRAASQKEILAYTRWFHVSVGWLLLGWDSWATTSPLCQNGETFVEKGDLFPCSSAS